MDTPGFGVDTFSASWSAPDTGNTPVAGYLMRLVTDSGAVIADWSDVGDVLSVIRTLPVPLSPGQVYRVLIQPYNADATGTHTSSDGFELAPDWFEVAVVEPEADAGPAPQDVIEDLGPELPPPAEDVSEDDIGPPGDAETEEVAPPDTSTPQGPTSSGCGGCSGGGPTPVDAALWGLMLGWWFRRSRRALR